MSLPTAQALSESEARHILSQCLQHRYNETAFRNLAVNLFPAGEKLTEGHNSGSYIKAAFQDYILSFKRIHKLRGQENIDVLAVKLKTSGNMLNARAMQRRFIAQYLNGQYGGKIKDAALVAFYTEELEDWRLSLVHKSYTFGENGPDVDLSEPKRSSFLVGPGEFSHTAQEQLTALLKKPDRQTLNALAAAFNVEKVTDAFFQEYKNLFDKLQNLLHHHLQSNPSLEAEFTRTEISPASYAKRLLGQIVFLYFIQKKGWLGVPPNASWGQGSPDYLYMLFEKNKTQGNNFFSSTLNPLFYEALAVDRSTQDHFFPLLGCRIPFLNGGLFEPLGRHDWKNLPLHLENTFFEELFTTFNRYNFTVREDEPLESEVAIDPEMLGKVFESLLDAEERRSSGTFYTPRPIVHYMCRESLVLYLDTKLNLTCTHTNKNKTNTQNLLPGVQAKAKTTQISLIDNPIKVYKRQEKVPLADIEALIRQDEQPETKNLSESEQKKRSAEYTEAQTRILPESVQQYAQELDAALACVRVCDPAIGSGAFPVGMMHEIVHARHTLHTSCVEKFSQPLSMYSLKRHTIGTSLYGVDKDASAVDIAKLRLWLSLVVDEEDYTHIKPLPNLDYKIVVGNSLDAMRDTYTNSLVRLEEFENLKKLHAQFFDTTNAEEKKSLREGINVCREKLGCHNAFDWKIDFAEVFAEAENAISGFDIAIANPPYIRHERIRDQKEQLKKQFGPFFCSTADLYTYFYALTLGGSDTNQGIVCPNGFCCFIAPNKFFRAAYGKNLRKLLLSPHVTLKRIVDFEDLPVFKAATTYPSILLAQKSEKTKGNLHSALVKNMEDLPKLWQVLVETSQSIPLSQLTDEAWVLENSQTTSLLAKIQRAGKPLKEVVEGKIFRGVLTGFNDAFVVDTPTRNKLVEQDPACTPILKPWLRGKDIKKWCVQDAGLWVINILSSSNKKWPWSGKGNAEAEAIFQKTFPSLYFHFHSQPDWREKLINRDDQGHYFWELRSCAYAEEFEKEKAIFPEFTVMPSVAFDHHAYFGNNKTIIITHKPKLVAAICNSCAFHFYYTRQAAMMRGGYYEYKVTELINMPIPTPTPEQETCLTSLVGKILALKTKDPAAHVAAIEAQIDTIVFDTYGLTEEERRIICDALRQNNG